MLAPLFPSQHNRCSGDGAGTRRQRTGRHQDCPAGAKALVTASGCLTEFIPFPPELHRGFIFSLPDGSTCSPTVHFVDTSRGSLRFQWVDLILPGCHPFPIGRVHDSLKAMGGAAGDPAAGQADFGSGWSFDPGAAVVALPGSDEMALYPDGTAPIRFVREEAARYVPARAPEEAGWAQLIVLPDGSLEAEDGAGTHHRFTASSRPGLYLLAEVEDPEGHQVRFLRRHGLLERIETDQGDFVEFLRDDTPSLGSAPLAHPPLVRGLRDSLGRSVQFRYDATGRLEQVVTVDGERFDLVHDLHGRLLSISHETDVPILSVSYRPDGRVSRVGAKGSAWRYQYDHAGAWTVVSSEDGGEKIRIDHAGGRRPRRGTERGGLEPADPGPFDHSEVVQEGENPCDGFCEPEFSGSECINCFGGGGGGGGTGGGGNEASCSGFSLSVSPTSGFVSEFFRFSVQRGSECTGSTTWLTGDSQVSCSSGSDTCTTYYSTPGTKTVAASIGSSSQSRTVTVFAPACTLSISGPISPVVGDQQTYTASGTCQDIQWGVNGTACFSSNTGSSFTTTFGSVGPADVVAEGNNGFGSTTVALYNVQVQSCSVSISGPSSGTTGSILCYDAFPSTTGIYTWTVDGLSSQGGSSHCVAFSSPGTHFVRVALTKTGCGSVDCGSATRTVSISDPPPRLDTLSPALGMVGNVVRVVLSGSGFTPNPTINAGSGIGASIVSVTDTTITADFDISLNSPAGTHTVTVSNSNGTSQPVSFFVQIPSSLTIASSSAVPHGPSETTDDLCVPPFAPSDGGIKASITYQVRDQVGNEIRVGGLVPYEDIRRLEWYRADTGVFLHSQPDRLNQPLGGSRLGTPPATLSNGQFVDAPFGACAITDPFVPFRHTAQQTIYIRLLDATGTTTLGSWVVQDLPIEVSALAGGGSGTVVVGGTVVASRP